MSSSLTVRTMILCDTRGRIIAAMPNMLAPRSSSKDTPPLPGAAGIITTKGTYLYEINVPKDLLSVVNGSMSKLVEDYVIRTARRTHGDPQLIKRRVTTTKKK